MRAENAGINKLNESIVYAVVLYLIEDLSKHFRMIGFDINKKIGFRYKKL